MTIVEKCAILGCSDCPNNISVTVILNEVKNPARIPLEIMDAARPISKRDVCTNYGHSAEILRYAQDDMQCTLTDKPGRNNGEVAPRTET
ncbi:MAG: hypothetical protein UX17_C0044G0015 [Parcubacteria group bacterium GW2011_GWC2_45_7]|nr:MAG: hypothetical protein UX17_C0044G0015 [Parcubacteria group bacterium GW2011_GWC2_45_7]